MERPLLIVETIFCDYERDDAVLARYLDRFRLCMLSLSRLDLDAADCAVLIYVSQDKATCMPLIAELVAKLDRPGGVRFVLARYSHPLQGYKVPNPNHVDHVKNPNRLPAYRDALFARFWQLINLDRPGWILRASIDDDDILLPHQLKQFVMVAEAAVASSDTPVLAIGLDRVAVAHVDGARLAVSDVRFRRAINGNKFFVVRDRSLLGQCSPWGLPEVMDTDMGARFAERSTTLLMAKVDLAPGFVYMRRGTNLSVQDKKGFFTAEVDQRCSAEFDGTLEQICETARFETAIGGSISFYLSPASVRLELLVQGASFIVETNFDRLHGADDTIAFYLLKDRVRIDRLPYSRSGNVSFHFSGAKGDYQVKAFIKHSDGSITTALSRRVTI